MIKVLFFGPVADRVGQRELKLDYTPDMTLHDVMQVMDNHHPGTLNLISFTALNQQQVRNQRTALQDGDEIAFMAKFSGG